jgi:hypothetical protein
MEGRDLVLKRSDEWEASRRRAPLSPRSFAGTDFLNSWHLPCYGCLIFMDYWEKKLRCGHARRGGGREQRRLEGGRAVRVFAPAEEERENNGSWWVGEPLGGAAYTCKGRVEGNSGGWQVAGSPFAGKDRYEFEKFFAPRTVLTLSESSPREVCGAGETIGLPSRDCGNTRQMIPV